MTANKRILIIGGLLLFAAIAGLLVLGIRWAGSGLRQVVTMSEDVHPADDRVESLMATVADESLSFDERNRAVWALGVIGDPHAIPLLESYYTGEPCDHEKYLCQYELCKAIKKCQGEFTSSNDCKH